MFINFAVSLNSLIYVLFVKDHIQQIPRAVTLLVTPKSSFFLLNSSINSLSKATALFLLQPVKLGNKVV